MDSDINIIFKEEASGHIVKSNNTLLALEEKGESPETLKLLKSEVHTLKGDSRMLGFQSVSQAAHRIEDFIHIYESGDSALKKATIDKIYSILDLMQQAIDALPEEKIDIDLTAYTTDGLAGSGKETRVEAQTAPPVKEIAVEEPTQPTQPTPATTGQKTDDQRAVKSEYININLDKIERLVQVSSAFPRYSSRFNYILNKLREIELYLADVLGENTQAKKLEDIIHDFSHELAFYDLAAKQFQDEVTKLKLVPLSSIFDQFPRLVRDVARSTNRKVNFVINGGEVELDKFMVDKIKNVLIHILRNAVDHGIEVLEERLKLGKQEKGRIRLNAFNKGDNVIIEVSDDGAGLDIITIRRKALEKGLITEKEAAGMGDTEIIALIFESGFSTKQLSTFSGRGVGMDVVAETIKEMNGEIQVRSVLGKGSTFTITLPLVSSYLPVTIFTLGDRLYGIPSSYVDLVMYVKEEQIKEIDEERLHVEVKGIDISLIDLQQVFGLGKKKRERNLKLIICRYQDEMTGFIITDVVLEKKLIIARTEVLVEQLNIILGGVLLGIERIIPVMNIPQLFKVLKNKSGSFTRVEGSGESTFDIGFKNILVVEDSIVTRTSEKRMLVKQNFNVYEAANGQEALELLKKQKIDCIFSDIEMPIMNGIEFIAKIKADPQYSDIPIIVVSSYKNYGEKLEDLKVNHFIDKGEFSSDNLLLALKKVDML